MVSMTTGNWARQPEVRVCVRGRAQPSMARRLCARCWRGDSSLFSMQPPDCNSLPFGPQTQHKNDPAPTARRREHTLEGLAPSPLLSCALCVLCRLVHMQSAHTWEHRGHRVQKDTHSHNRFMTRTGLRGQRRALRQWSDRKNRRSNDWLSQNYSTDSHVLMGLSRRGQGVQWVLSGHSNYYSD